MVEVAGGTGGVEMIIHYQNRNGEEKFIRNVIHLQNVGGGEFVALFEGEKTLTLLVDRIEGIYGKDEDETT